MEETFISVRIEVVFGGFMMEPRQREYIGNGKISQLGEVISETRARKALVVTGRSDYADRLYEDHIQPAFGRQEHIRYTGSRKLPTVEDVQQGMAIARRENCSLVIGAGGGVALDIGKAVAMLAPQDGGAQQYVTGESPLVSRSMPTIMIPTTAGTGSEATSFAVVYINGTKYSLAHHSMLPEYAIVDPRLTMSVPPQVAAATGLDALTQAVESLWSVGATTVSRRFSKAGMRMALTSLVGAVNEPDLDNRGAMCFASNNAGKAINIAKTTAAHAVSYPMTAHWDVPHGYAVALTLPSFVEYNMGVDGSSLQAGADLGEVRSVMSDLLTELDCRDGSEAKAKLTQLVADIGLPTTLSGAGIPRSGVAKIMGEINPDRVRNNPRVVTEEALRSILEAIF